MGRRVPKGAWYYCVGRIGIGYGEYHLKNLRLNLDDDCWNRNNKRTMIKVSRMVP